MAILIEGMEMPKQKMVVNIYADGRVTRPFDELGKTIGKAVPVPPHGRLGDLDELKTAFPCGESIRTESIRATIDHMPTIIPASEEGEA